jgi:hypothetical protein
MIDTFYSNITIIDFKDFFLMDFIRILGIDKPFNAISKYDINLNYNKDIEVYNVNNFFIYQSLQTPNQGNDINNESYWLQKNNVLRMQYFIDEEITQAMQDALYTINRSFDSQLDEIKRIAFLYLSAYILTTNKNNIKFQLTIPGLTTGKSIAGANVSKQYSNSLITNVEKLTYYQNIFGKKYYDMLLKILNYQIIDSYSPGFYNV